MKSKKGLFAVLVGMSDDKDLHKFMIPVSYLHHPSLESLLERAHELYGYQAAGPLRLPCSLDEFLHLKSMIEQGESNNKTRRSKSLNDHRRHHHHRPFQRSLSFTSCFVVDDDD